MRRLRGQIPVLVLLLTLGSSIEAFSQTVGTTTGAINGKVTDAIGRCAARRHRDDQPARRCRARAPTSPTRTAFTASPAIPPGEYKITYELGGFRNADSRSAARRPRIHGDGEHRAAASRAVGSVTVSGQSPVVDVATTKTSTNFDCAAARRAAERARLLGDSRGGAGHPDAAHRRRRQRRRHADRLLHLRHEVRSASADGRGHRQHGRHQRRRVLLRLRIGRGSVGHDRRQHARRCRGPA